VAFLQIYFLALALEYVSVLVPSCLKRLFKVRLFDVSTVANRVTDNGLRIGDGGAFEKRQPNICTNAR